MVVMGHNPYDAHGRALRGDAGRCESLKCLHAQRLRAARATPAQHWSRCGLRTCMAACLLVVNVSLPPRVLVGAADELLD